MTQAHCCACHRQFSGVYAFDLHRSSQRGHGVCLAPQRLVSRGEDGEARRVLFLVDDVWGFAPTNDKIAGLVRHREEKARQRDL